MIGDDDIRKSLRDVAEFLRDRAELHGYGYYHPANPHDFHPDPECCTPEEIERHRAACDAYDRGEAVTVPPPWTEHATREEAEVHAAKCIADGAASAIVSPGDGYFVVHSHVGGWGMGSYTEYDEELLAVAKRLDSMADEMPMESAS